MNPTALIPVALLKLLALAAPLLIVLVPLLARRRAAASATFLRLQAAAGLALIALVLGAEAWALFAPPLAERSPPAFARVATADEAPAGAPDRLQLAVIVADTASGSAVSAVHSTVIAAAAGDIAEGELPGVGHSIRVAWPVDGDVRRIQTDIQRDGALGPRRSTRTGPLFPLVLAAGDGRPFHVLDVALFDPTELAPLRDRGHRSVLTCVRPLWPGDALEEVPESAVREALGRSVAAAGVGLTYPGEIESAPADGVLRLLGEFHGLGAVLLALGVLLALLGRLTAIQALAAALMAPLLLGSLSARLDCHFERQALEAPAAVDRAVASARLGRARAFAVPAAEALAAAFARERDPWVRAALVYASFGGGRILCEQPGGRELLARARADSATEVAAAVERFDVHQRARTQRAGERQERGG